MHIIGDDRRKYLLYNIGTELLNGKCADIAYELANDGITESVIVEIEDVLNNLLNQMSRRSGQHSIKHPHNCHKGPAQVSTHCTLFRSQVECAGGLKHDQCSVEEHSNHGDGLQPQR